MWWNHGVGYIKARKPASIDSLKINARSDDYENIMRYAYSSEEGEEATVYYDDLCGGKLLYMDQYCYLTVDITFFCGDKKVELPSYKIETKTDIFLNADNLKFYITEFDERKISGDYTIETFLAPEDTSCGKFVNYAVLKVEED